jgi:molybdate transport system ATP-binding protein
MELLRLHDAARLVGVSYPTLKQWIYSGKIKSVKTAGGHHHIPRSEVDRLTRARERASALLELMKLSPLARRYPHELSGGQQQRVAIARVLAMEGHALLMDEPFSALDNPTRKLLHRDLLALQRETRLVVIYVTHSLDDAVAVGDRLAVMREGRIEQIGALEEALRRQANQSVADALGK